MNSPVFPPPRKRFGQNFLVDQNIVRKIIALAALQEHELALEIGPGRGALTKSLCQVASKVVAIEIDTVLCDFLQTELSGCSNLTLHAGDALNYPYETLPLHTVVVANLPYNISTPLLFTLFDARDSVDRIIVMVQLEVAKRIVAKPKTRDYGVLSVLSQYFAETQLAFKVPRTCFRPRPDVESAVIELRLNPGDGVTTMEEVQSFVHVVKSAFGHRRKTLLNAMRDAGFVPRVLRSAFDRAGIDGTRRAETLSVQEFQLLAHSLSFSRDF